MPTGKFEPTSIHGTIEVIGSIVPLDLKTFDPTTRLTDTFKDGSPAKAKFGFVFRRYYSDKVYAVGRGTPSLARVGVNDDSDRKFQDVDPGWTPSLETVISDVDAPNLIAKPTANRYMSHARIDFDEWNVFHFYADQPERSSGVLKWAFTGDGAINYEDKVTYILGAANDGVGANEVLVGSHLTSLDIGVAKASLSSAINRATNDKKIRSSVNNDVVVTGQNLVGEFFLRKAGVADMAAEVVRVKTTDPVANYSDLTEVRATFRALAPDVGTGYSLVVKNAAGESNVLDGFEIT